MHLGIDLDLRDDHRLGPAGDAGHQRQVAAVAPHHLDQEGALVRGGRHLQPVDRLQRDVERGVDADRDLGAGEIVVDRRRDADHREAHLGQRQRAGLRAVAADHHQAVDAAGAEAGEGAARGPSSSRNSGQRALPRMVPPAGGCRPRRGRRGRRSCPRSAPRSRRGRRRPPSPCRWPVRTTARMAAFIPGASPPLVKTAIFRAAMARIL